MSHQTIRRTADAVAADHAALVEALGGRVFTLDVDGRLADAGALFGSGQGSDGNRDRDWLDAIDGADRRALSLRWASARTAGRRLEDRARLAGTRSDGPPAVIRFAPVRGADGAVLRWIGVITDAPSALPDTRDQTFRVLADSMPQIVWSTLPDGDHDYFNQRWYDFTGVPVGSTDGEGWNGVFHPDDQPLAWERWRHSLETGDLYQIEYRLRRRDGVYRWVLGRALPQRGPEGQILRWFGTCTDIDDLKRAEAALLESETNFRILANAIPQMAWMTDLEGRVTWFNRRWQEYTGHDAATPDANQGPDTVHPDDRDSVLSRFGAAIESGTPWEDTIRLRAADGSYRWFLSRAVPVAAEDGRILRWIGTNTDVTAQREVEADLRRSEVRFRSLVEATAAVVWTANADGSLGAHMPGWSDFTGQTPEDFAGLGWLAAVHPDDRSRTTKDWVRAFSNRQLYETEHRLRRADGVYRAMMVRATPIKSASGAIEEWVGIHTDITDLKEAEAALLRLNETLEAKVEARTTLLLEARHALERANRELEVRVEARTSELQAANDEIKRFAYIVSHDLRAPLVNIMGFTSELEAARETLFDFHTKAIAAAPALAGGAMADLVETDFDEALGFIRSSTAQMDRLINAILTLSRAERRVLVPEPIPMASFLAAYGSSFAHQLGAHPAELVIETVPDIVADRLALDQVFANVIENAVKYLQPGRKGRIVVSGRDEGESVVFDIADNGRGIDAKDFERIFELFRRAGVQDQPGEGIGLAHVRALVRKMGGTIRVASTPGQGSTFTLRLPKTSDEYHLPS